MALSLVVSMGFSFLANSVQAQTTPTQGDYDWARQNCYYGYCDYGDSTGRLDFSKIPEVRKAQEAQAAYEAKNLVSLGSLISAQAGVMGFTGASLFQMIAGGQVKKNDQDITYIDKGGAIGAIHHANVAMLMNRPASTETYVADLLNNAGIGIVQPAYAQGLGFAALSPVLEAWKTFRNIAYLFFIVITLIIGFMIMFRQKVGSNAITAQQAIPKVIIALLAVTFSYAIAGLLIDIMYLFMFFIAAVFNYKESFDKSIFSLGWELITAGAGTANDAISNLAERVIDIPILDNLGAVEFLSGLTAALIVGIAILFAIFKLFFELLKTYVTIIISIVMAPLLLMFDAIPGRNSFGSWIKSLIANLAAFPTVLIVLLIYRQLTQNASGGYTEGGFSPPYLLGTFTDQAGVIPMLVGLGIILALPEAVTKVKSALGASEGPFGELLKAGWAAARAQTGRAAAVAAAPVLGGAGAYVGYKAADKIAGEMGLQGRERTLARLGGLGIGAGLGVRAPQIAGGVMRGTFNQVRDTLVSMQVGKFKTDVDAAQNAQAQASQRQIAEDNVAKKRGYVVGRTGQYVPHSRAKDSTGVSQADLDDLT